MRVALTSVLGAVLLLSAGSAILGYRRWQTYRQLKPDLPPADQSAG
jgi:hypothetical protein